MKVLFTQGNMHTSGIEFLREKGYEIVIGETGTEENIIKNIKDCDGVITRLDRITEKIIDSAPKLKVIGKYGVGTDNIAVDYAEKKGVQVVNAPYSNINSVAEFTMLAVMYCAKNIGIIVDEFRNGNHNIKDQVENTSELSGLTLGLIGSGKIAKLVAKKAYYGFGMNVIMYSPHIKKSDELNFIKIAESKQEVLTNSDIVSVHIPSTKETKRSFGMNEFKLMKKSGIFINTSRGDIVIEDELIKALNDKVIRGAAMDVFEKEPPDKNNPLLTMSNVLATPHCAAQTEKAKKDTSLCAAQGVYEVLEKMEISFPVNHIKH